MFIFVAAQMVTGAGSVPTDCLAPLTKEERKQDDAARASKRKAANLPILEPDDDLLPLDAPADFKPVLMILSYALGPNGTVSDCTIQKPSGIAGLDTASCELLRRHFPIRTASQPLTVQEIAINWTPRTVNSERRACNNNGGAIPVSMDRWITSDVFSRTTMQAGSALVALDIGKAGQIAKCIVRSSNISAILQHSLCKMAVQNGVVLPAVDSEGHPKATTLLFVTRFVLR